MQILYTDDILNKSHLLESFVNRQGNDNIFQSLNMFNVYNETRNYTPIFIGISDQSDMIIATLLAVIQKEFQGLLDVYSSRCIIYGGPIILKKLSIKTQQIILNTLLMELFKTVQNKCLYIQIRNHWDQRNFFNVFLNNDYEYEDHLNYFIDLTQNQNTLWNTMSKTRRKGISKANQYNLEFEEYSGDINIDNIYNLIQETYTNVKIPLVDISFFKSLNKYLINSNQSKIFIVRKRNEIFSVRVVLLYNKTIYDFFAGSTEQGKSVYSNEYLVWKILLWGMKNNYHLFDFGGAGNPKEHYGPREFKRRFGGYEVNFGRFINIVQKQKYRLAKIGLKIFKR